MTGIGGGKGSKAEKLGYLGLGMMGFPMARRLLDAGYRTRGLEPLHRQGQSPGRGRRKARHRSSQYRRTASIIFMCVTDAAAVEDVVFGANGLASVPGSGKLVVDFSSIHPDAARDIATRLKMANGMGWIDAPVSGGSKGAEEGTLAVMAGGDAADIERVRPYVLAMARRLTHMGPTGAGQTTKLCNQIIVGCAMAVLAEATRLASNAGIDAGKLPEALAGGFADSIPLQFFVPRMVQGIHSPPLGHIATILKDLDTVVDVAQATSTPCADGSLAAQIFRLGKAARGADVDALEIYKLSAAQAVEGSLRMRLPPTSGRINRIDCGRTHAALKNLPSEASNPAESRMPCTDPAGVKTSSEISIPEQMKAWVLGEPDELFLRDKPTPVPRARGSAGPHRAVAICATDLEIIHRGSPASIQGGLPFNKNFTPGHEYMGTVAALGPHVDEFKIGERVTVEIHAGCGQCKRCRKGMYTSCLNYGKPEKGHRANGFTTDGGFAEYAVNHINTIMPVPDSMSDPEATLVVTAGTSMYGLTELGGLVAGESVVVIGPGPIGLLAVAVAKALGASPVVLTGTRDKRLAIGKELGADRVINVGNENPVDIVKQLTGGIGADYVIECAGIGSHHRSGHPHDQSRRQDLSCRVSA